MEEERQRQLALLRQRYEPITDLREHQLRFDSLLEKRAKKRRARSIEEIAFEKAYRAKVREKVHHNKTKPIATKSFLLYGQR